ncbi:MAG: diadenylate cyclase CdaA [Desulfovibrionaceae bacterium]|nr:diadenylate cyclase CdaA [Desulfovibrionaceae bacterium]
MMEWNQIPFGWREALDITVVTFLLYHVIRFVRGTRAVAALSGLFVLLVLYAVAQMAGLLTLSWLLEAVFGSLFLVIVILFQQDIRQALSSMSLRSLFRRRTGGHEELIGILARSCFDLAGRHIGALIVIEMTMPLGDMMEKGVKIDGLVSEDLLSTIFFPKTALHDGAVIVNVSGRVVAAGCVLPLAQEVARQHFGTRHRAALGITEVSDAVVLVVSEERGEVTVAQNGRLSNPLNYERLERILTNVLSH